MQINTIYCLGIHTHAFICSKSTKKGCNHLQDRGYFWGKMEENEIKEEYTKDFNYIFLLFIKMDAE